MTDHTLYISPEYNPHSLYRDWGFFMRTSSPDIYTCLSQGPDLATLRQTLFDTLFDSLLDQATGQTGTSHPPGKSPAKVTTDAVTDDAPQLCQEVGLDTLTLALLADVPIHRPLHLSHNNLIGQWRWLRQVWRVCAPLPPVSEPNYCGDKAWSRHQKTKA